MIYVDDVGAILELEFRDYENINGVATDMGALDVSGASEITFLFTKPDGTSGTSKTKTGAEVVFSIDGTDGKAKYVTESGFLDQAGTWRRQGKVEIGGNTHYSEVVTFPVAKHL